MLASSRLQTIVWTSRISEAEKFYSGVSLERFAGFPHDPAGILALPDGAKVAWFRDPDGNLLSVVQYAPSET